MDDPIERIKRHELYRPGKKVRPSTLAAWEQNHKASLPIEYRRFLLEIGEQAYYPFGDLLPLKSWWHHLTGESSCAASLPWLHEPFALPEKFSTHQEWAAWSEQWSLLNRKQPWAGTITLTDEGCGMRSLLVLKGPFRGRVCFLDLPKPPWVFPQGNFLDWFFACLEARRTRSFAGLVPAGLP